jgi:hypothetical protein
MASFTSAGCGEKAANQTTTLAVAMVQERYEIQDSTP